MRTVGPRLPGLPKPCLRTSSEGRALPAKLLIVIHAA